jgi:hypothetical protein
MQGLLQQPTEQPAEQPVEDGGPDGFGDPALTKSIEYVGERLYSEEVGTEIAAAFDASPTDNPDAIALIAYKLTQKADEASGGEIAEENLSLLGMLTLNEVLTVAEAAGMPIKPETGAKAMKRMVVMFAADNGIPIEQIQEAFSQVSESELSLAAEEAPDNFDEMIADGDSPVGEEIEQGLSDDSLPEQRV